MSGFKQVHESSVNVTIPHSTESPLGALSDVRTELSVTLRAGEIRHQEKLRSESERSEQKPEEQDEPRNLERKSRMNATEEDLRASLEVSSWLCQVSNETSVIKKCT